MNRRHHLRSLLAAGAVLGATFVAASPAEAARSTLSVRPAIAGETTSVTGRVPKASKARTVQLQRYVNRRWTTIRTTKTSRTGSFSIPMIEPSAATKVRVYAPKSRGKKKTYTPIRVATPQPQRAALALPVGARPSSTTTASVAFSPARPGRPFTIQRIDAGRWVNVASGRQSSAGNASIATPTGPAGTATYRVLGSAFRGAPAIGSAVRTIELGAPEVVGRTADGALFDEDTMQGTLNGDGRYIAFASQATNTGFANPQRRLMLWLKDRETGQVRPITRNHVTGVAPAGHSQFPQISDDGRWVVFQSSADDLVHNDSNGLEDAFIWDRTTGETELLSIGQNGQSAEREARGPSISRNGRYVTWITGAPSVTGTSSGIEQVVRLDRETDERIVVTRARDGMWANAGTSSATAGDTGKVTFVSDASNLVANDTNKQRDVFQADPARQKMTGLTTHLSTGTGSASADRTGDRVVYGNVLWFADGSLPRTLPGSSGYISADGTTLLLDGSKQSLSGAVAHDLATGREVPAAEPFPGGTSKQPTYRQAISGDGDVALYSTQGSDFVGPEAGRPYRLVVQKIRW